MNEIMIQIPAMQLSGLYLQLGELLRNLAEQTEKVQQLTELLSKEKADSHDGA